MIEEGEEKKKKIKQATKVIPSITKKERKKEKMVIINFLSLLLTTDVSGKGAHDEHLFLKEDQKKRFHPSA